jgi:chromosome segregation ATPase
MKKHFVVIGLLLLLASVVVLALTPAERDAITINRICDMVEDGSVSPEHASEIAKQRGIEYTPDQFAAEKSRRKEEKDAQKKLVIKIRQLGDMVRVGSITPERASEIAKLHGIEYTPEQFANYLPIRPRQTVFEDVVKRDSNTSHSNSDDLASRLDDLESKINDLDSKYSDLDSKLDDLESKINDLDSKYSDLDSKLDDLESKINDLDSKYSDLDSRVDDLETLR